jgi:hypothetical protein
MAEKLQTEILLRDISQKLNILISLYLRSGSQVDLTLKGSKRGVGDIARYLSSMGLDAKDVAAITGSPLASVRTLLTPGRKK